jgi:hypothetical protein
MTDGGKKQIELELSRIGVALDSIEKINPFLNRIRRKIKK